MVNVFFPLQQYSLLLKLNKLPKKGDVLTITQANLVEGGDGIIPVAYYGYKVHVGRKCRRNRGFEGEKERYPAFFCTVKS